MSVNVPLGVGAACAALASGMGISLLGFRLFGSDEEDHHEEHHEVEHDDEPFPTYLVVIAVAVVTIVLLHKLRLYLCRAKNVLTISNIRTTVGKIRNKNHVLDVEPDPYVEFKIRRECCDHETKRTKCKNNESEHVKWDDTIELENLPSDLKGLFLEVTLYDKNMLWFLDKKLGHNKIALESFHAASGNGAYAKVQDFWVHEDVKLVFDWKKTNWEGLQ
jgi:hypothetical protein